MRRAGVSPVLPDPPTGPATPDSSRRAISRFRRTGSRNRTNRALASSEIIGIPMDRQRLFPVIAMAWATITGCNQEKPQLAVTRPQVVLVSQPVTREVTD